MAREAAAVATPLGTFFVVAEEGALVQSGFGEVPPLPPGALAEAAGEAVARYFAGEALASFPLRPRVSPFYARVYRELSKTRPGEVLSYGELARRAGRPGAARAVGRAMAENPLPLFVPCHRVIPASGRLGGYGLFPWRKAALLLLEAGEPDLEDRLPRLRAHPDLASVRLGDLLGDGEP